VTSKELCVAQFYVEVWDAHADVVLVVDDEERKRWQYSDEATATLAAKAWEGNMIEYVGHRGVK